MTENALNETNSEPNPAPVFSAPPKQEKPPGRQYRLPDMDEVNYLSPKEAEMKLKELDSDVSADVKHPYMSRRHPLHDDYIAYGLSLRKAAAEGRENVYEKALRESREIQQERQDARVAEAEKLVEELVSLGFDDTAVDNDIAEWQIDVWRMQKLCAEKDFAKLGTVLEKELRILRAPPGTVAALEAFRGNDSMDAGLREQIAEQVIQFVYNARKGKGDNQR
jgi:hypothetical protein